MSAIKDSRTPITLDKERHLLFSLNVLDELQDKAGDIGNLGEILYNDNKINLKNLKWILTLLLNEGAPDDEEPLSERQVGKLIPAGRLQEVIKLVLAAFSKGNNGDEPAAAEDTEDEDTEDDEKNVKSGKVK